MNNQLLSILKKLATKTEYRIYKNIPTLFIREVVDNIEPVIETLQKLNSFKLMLMRKYSEDSLDLVSMALSFHQLNPHPCD